MNGLHGSNEPSAAKQPRSKRKMPTWGKVVIICESIFCAVSIAFFCLAMWLALTGYDSPPQQAIDDGNQKWEKLDKTVQRGSASISYPSSWEVVEGDDADSFQVVSKDNKASMRIARIDRKNASDSWLVDFASSVSDDCQNLRNYSIDGSRGKRFRCHKEINGRMFGLEGLIATTDKDTIACIVGASDPAYRDVEYDIISSLRISAKDSSGGSVDQKSDQPPTDKPAPKAETPQQKSEADKPKAKTQSPPPAPKPSATTSQTNALKSAGSYLKNVGGFSHSGLIEQLEYEDFSAEDATWAADNCGADWNAQARQSAASYMKSVGGFSRGGLIDQLEYEGFTPDQAAIGADSVGL